MNTDTTRGFAWLEIMPRVIVQHDKRIHTLHVHSESGRNVIVYPETIAHEMWLAGSGYQLNRSLCHINEFENKVTVVFQVISLI
jgi:hypothetical protein